MKLSNNKKNKVKDKKKREGKGREGKWSDLQLQAV
jgi:hypothetical protein